MVVLKLFQNKELIKVQDEVGFLYYCICWAMPTIHIFIIVTSLLDMKPGPTESFLQ